MARSLRSLRHYGYTPITRLHQNESNTEENCMKIDRRGIILMALGAVQLLVGAFFITIGAWALKSTKSVIKKTQYVPFWMVAVCFINGYLLLVTPTQDHKCCIISLLNLLVTSCIFFAAVSGWLLAHVLAASDSNETTFAAGCMSLAICALIFHAIALAVTWSSKDRGFRKNSQGARENYSEPPPSYWSHQQSNERVVYLQRDNVAYIHAETVTPPPPPYSE